MLKIKKPKNYLLCSGVQNSEYYQFMYANCFVLFFFFRSTINLFAGVGFTLIVR